MARTEPSVVQKLSCRVWPSAPLATKPLANANRTADSKPAPSLAPSPERETMTSVVSMVASFRRRHLGSCRGARRSGERARESAGLSRIRGISARNPSGSGERGCVRGECVGNLDARPSLVHQDMLPHPSFARGLQLCEVHAGAKRVARTVPGSLPPAFGHVLIEQRRHVSAPNIEQLESRVA